MNRKASLLLVVVLALGAVWMSRQIATAQTGEGEADLHVFSIQGIKITEAQERKQVFPLSQMTKYLGIGSSVESTTTQPMTYTFTPGDKLGLVWGVWNEGPGVAASVHLSKTTLGWEILPQMTSDLGDMIPGFWGSWGVAAYFQVPDNAEPGIYDVTFYASSSTTDPDPADNSVVVHIRVSPTLTNYVYLPALMKPEGPENFGLYFTRDHEQDPRAVWLHLSNPLAANQQADWSVSCVGRDPWPNWSYYNPVQFNAQGEGQFRWPSLHGGWEDRWPHEGHDQYGDCSVVLSSAGWTVTQSLYVDRTTVAYVSPWPDPNKDWVPPGTQSQEFVVWSPDVTLYGLPLSEVIDFILVDGSYGQVRLTDGIWRQPLGQPVNGRFEVAVTMDGEALWGYKTFHSRIVLLTSDSDPWPSSAMQSRYGLIGLDEGGIYP
ncbi:hypothetical protein A3F07_02415 [candidate division WWE3 bacterium RIFCSPHIGHO2_12_FULL_38_15]|uniref:Uncharacterized protein n=1 Tax=candidate division WWE3 bacterium RIFCSPHIGHO2_02_FULL_38_14 TaxID=1802620 RepID=A0A1F4V678_UNCKA|nr:MAG: hypothetical protein A2793_02610 [candidate division WWE3 bacterium RIFCSPHIGHO2_01_FULL_38_45]OGC48766.1 MAG: hypothetical protein A3F07_02415 [candidate division WWE3 bacterium RIFCSPHIGHO2_12_FULL_38_15]OGC52633.1 MAG: hypothetical protein A3B64_03860 [candidate division WWE3 bacterium RIFCSPLOWO2_01_FULL_37_24]OGC52689.1 MAG: hypothetical protein A3D91_03395 [candidate division WWE3 bacterium RIFCSPHIGHO2_02_FULL_38_14]